ncbi:MAG TPA: PHP domain-containing protein [Solirubrobacteraceae bacterium]|jgi:hypothetical protein|nr:PHP domain-containing protein [Solirubrobacteraceae bacterium]
MPATNPPRFDLQSHSTCSDGALPPAGVVAAAAAAGVQALALSDHDSVEGVAEAIAAGREHGVRIVRAVEISAIHRGELDLHILGYGIDHEHPALAEALEAYRRDRDLRAHRMGQALIELGFTVDLSFIDERQAAGQTVGRPHLAEAVVGEPANAERLAAEGIDGISPMIASYLIEGKPAFRMREIPTVSQAVELIHRVGGVAVWAHPFWDIKDAEDVGETIGVFRDWGIDGVEAFYVTHDREQTLFAAEQARSRGMLTTGSSDFHGPEHKLFSRFCAFELHGLTPELGPILD